MMIRFFTCFTKFIITNKYNKVNRNLGLSGFSEDIIVCFERNNLGEDACHTQFVAGKHKRKGGKL